MLDELPDRVFLCSRSLADSRFDHERVSYLGPTGLRGYEGRIENQVEKKQEHEFRTSMMQEDMHVLDI